MATCRINASTMVSTWFFWNILISTRKWLNAKGLDYRTVLLLSVNNIKNPTCLEEHDYRITCCYQSGYGCVKVLCCRELIAIPKFINLVTSYCMINKHPPFIPMKKIQRTYISLFLFAVMMHAYRYLCLCLWLTTPCHRNMVQLMSIKGTLINDGYRDRI